MLLGTTTWFVVSGQNVYAQAANLEDASDEVTATYVPVDIDNTVAILQANGCSFGYGDSLSDDLFQWHEYACVRVDGSKLEKKHWSLLLELPDLKLLSLHNTKLLPHIANVLRQC